ncbi:MAG TPA: hypothetical protein VGJ54_00865, partial [Streptosporangiaceae bacterium]
AERTRVICRLRWHLHELDPAWEPKTRSLDRISALDQVEARIACLEGTSHGWHACWRAAAVSSPCR